MKIPWSHLTLVMLASFSDIVASQTATGTIMIDNQEFVSGSSRVIKGNGRRLVDKRTLTSFSKLSVDIAANIEFIASNRYQVEVTGDENIVPLITSTVSNGTLLIESRGSFSTQNILHIKVYGSPALNGLIANGSSDIKLVGLKGLTLKIDLDGAGDLTAQGSMQNLELIIDGSTSVNMRELQADNVTLSIGGSADAIVTANNILNVTIDGAGDVVYYGNPEVINQEIDGAGDITAGD